jgi:predicted nucleic acid-binding protein
MHYLVDTNVLLRLVEREHEHHIPAVTAIRKLRNERHILRSSYQNFIEFWNVATRPRDKNGLGCSPTEAKSLLQSLEDIYLPLSDSHGVYPEWRRLVVQHNVSGVKVHDARLVAVMKTNAITHILTFNDADFTRFANEGIVAVNPKNV